MTVPDEAVEAAAQAEYEHDIQDAPMRRSAWGYVDTLLRDAYIARARAALTAAAPFIAAQATVLITDLIDPEPCSFDHNHSCQAHGYFYLKQGEACPQHDAKEWIKTYRSGT